MGSIFKPKVNAVAPPPEPEEAPVAEEVDTQDDATKVQAQKKRRFRLDQTVAQSLTGSKSGQQPGTAPRKTLG